MRNRIFLIVVVLATVLPGSVVAWASSNGRVEAELHLLHSDASGVVVSVSTPDYQIVQGEQAEAGFQHLEVAGYRVTADHGAPQLPVMSFLLGVPPDAQVDIHLLSEEIFALKGTYHLLPAPTPATLKEDFEPGDWVYSADPDIYALDALYPSTSVRIAEDAWLRDQRIVRVEVYPFQYNPVQGKLTWRKNLQFEVRFTASQPFERDAPVNMGISTNPFDQFLQEELLNYDSARFWRSLPQASSGIALTGSQPFQSLGPRMKIVVDQDGLYRLSYAELQSAGMDVDNIDPRYLSMSSQGQDVAILVSGEGDGSFDPGDGVIFYGEKFRGDHMAPRFASESDYWLTFPNGWKPQMNATVLEKYTDENVYWLLVGESTGLRMDSVDGVPAGAPTPAYYTETAHAEEAYQWWTWHFTGEDDFFWRNIQTSGVGASKTEIFPVQLSALAPGAPLATIRGEAVARVHATAHAPDHHTLIRINSWPNPIPGADAYWDGPTRYVFNLQVPQSALAEGENQLKFTVTNNAYPGQVTDWIRFDWFEIEYARLFRAEADRLFFKGSNSGAWQYVSHGFSTPGVKVLDITDPFVPRQVINSTVSAYGSGYEVAFQVTHAENARYFLAGSAAVRTPKSVTFYQPPDLFSPTNGADYIIISHPSFINSAQSLADYRAANGLRTMVINVDDLYNEFNDGIFFPYAIKNFLAYTFANWQPPAPGYVLLVGNGHWNIKHFPNLAGSDTPIFMPPNLGFVDPWQGEVDSTNLLANFIGNDLLPDVKIARLPVSTPAELNAYIMKLIAYENGPRNQDWQLRPLFVADNVDSTANFGALSDAIIAQAIPTSFPVDRIYMDSFNISGCPDGQAGTINQCISRHLNDRGTLILNYTGHGAIDYWAVGPRMFESKIDIPLLSNGSRLPVVLGMTCYDGFWNYPGLVSMASAFVTQENGGAVGVFSSTGQGLATGHDALQRGFYGSLFKAGVWELGAASQASKLALFATGTNYDLLNTYIVFGDPALQLISPYSLDLAVEEDALDTYPSAKVTYNIRVTNTGSLSDSFSLSVSDNIWQVSLPDKVGPIPAGQGIDVPVQVTIPPDAADGEQDVAQIQVTSKGDVSQERTTVVTTTSQFYGARFTPFYASQAGLPGTEVTYSFKVENNGAYVDILDLDISGYSWPTTDVPASIGPYAPGEGESIAVTVTIPAHVDGGELDVATLTATSRGDPTRSNTARLTTHATQIYGLELAPVLAAQWSEAGESITYGLLVTNTGNAADTFTVTLSSSSWFVDAPAVLGPVARNGSQMFDVTVDIPVEAIYGDQDQVTITVMSQASPETSKIARLFTSIFYKFFLPFVGR